MKVDGFDWDSGNLIKSETKHGISRDVVELFFQNEIRVAPDPKHSAAEDRFLALGRDEDGRPMIVAFTIRSRGGHKLVRPISARYLHAKEVKQYEQAFTQDKK